MTSVFPITNRTDRRLTSLPLSPRGMGDGGTGATSFFYVESGEDVITILVAASNAKDSSKVAADYICDGTADEVEINQALTALPSMGGTVVLSEGNFNLTAGITLPNKAMRLVGQGVRTARYNLGSATTLTWSLAAIGDCITFYNSPVPQALVGFTIVCDSVDTRYGIYVGDSCSCNRVEDVTVQDAVTAGVRLDSPASQHLFLRVQTWNCGYGFQGYGVDNRFIDCQASRSSLGGTSGFAISEGGSCFYSCHASYYPYGFHLRNFAQAILLEGCSVEHCTVGLYIGATAPDEPEGCVISGFFSLTSGTGAVGAIVVDRAYGTLIEGGYIGTTPCTVSVLLTVNAVDTTIIGGDFADATPISDAGSTRTHIMGLSGYVNENSGTGTILNTTTSIAVNHGLSITPSAANIIITPTESPTNDPGNIWVSAIGAATFTVNCRNDPGASNLDFSWRVVAA